MYDTTVLRPFGARDSSAITQRDPHPEEPGTLATGRTLPVGVSPRSLSEEELISCWADDRMASVSGAVSGAGQP